MSEERLDGEIERNAISGAETDAILENSDAEDASDKPACCENDEVKEPDTESAAGKDGGKKKFDIGGEIFYWGEAIAQALAIIILVFTFLVRLIGVDGTSMVPTLHDKDQVFVSNLFYDKPERGDIVVLRKETFLEDPIVKRVIATEGQTIDIDFAAHTVTVDGEVLYEPYINEPTERPGTIAFPLTVPEGCVFVMGDNRNRSSDSRVATLGTVDTRYIIGKVLYRVFPFNAIGGVN